MQCAACSGHRYLAVLQGLAHGLQHVPAELRQLVQKQHAVVGQGNLTRPHGGTTTGQCGGRGGVMRAAEGAAGQQGMLRVRQARHGPDAGDGQGLLPGHIRQNGGQPLGQHGLAGAGGTDEQQIVAARGGNLQGPLHVFLAHDVPQVRKIGGVRLRHPDRGGGEGLFSLQMGHQSFHIRNAVDRQPTRQGGLGGIFGGDKQLADARRFGRHRHGQHTGDAPQGAGKGQLTDESRIRRQSGQIAARSQDAHQDGQVVDSAGLFLPGGGQIDGDAADGELGAAVLHRRPDPLPGLPHGGVRQAHHVKSRQAAGEKTLGAHLVAGDAAETQRTHCNDHILYRLSRIHA